MATENANNDKLFVERDNNTPKCHALLSRRALFRQPEAIDTISEQHSSHYRMNKIFFFFLIINKALNLDFFFHFHHVPLDAWACRIGFSRLAKNHSRTTTRVVKHAVNISHRTSNVFFYWFRRR